MKARRLFGSMVLVMALVAGVFGTATPDGAAKTTKKYHYTMLKGEKTTCSVLFIGNLKSVKSSKSKVVSVKKVGSNKIKLTAKKAGKATINVKGRFGYGKYYITVKNKKLNCVYKGFSGTSYGGYAYYEVTNKCGDYVSSAQLTYDILDANGNVLKTADDMYLNALVPNTKTYVGVYINSELMGQGATSIQVKSYKIKHDMFLRYSNCTKKVSVNYDGSTGKLSIKSSAKKYVSVRIDIVFYDAQGNIVDLQASSAYLSAKGSDTKTVTTSKEYSTYKVFKRAYA